MCKITEIGYNSVFTCIFPKVLCSSRIQYKSQCAFYGANIKMLFTKDYEEYFFIVFQRDNTVIASSPCLSFAVV